MELQILGFETWRLGILCQALLLLIFTLPLVIFKNDYFELTQNKKPNTLIQWSALAQVGAPMTVIGGVRFKNRVEMKDVYEELNGEREQEEMINM